MNTKCGVGYLLIRFFFFRQNCGQLTPLFLVNMISIHSVLFRWKLTSIIEITRFSLLYFTIRQLWFQLMKFLQICFSCSYFFTMCQWFSMQFLMNFQKKLFSIIEMMHMAFHFYIIHLNSWQKSSGFAHTLLILFIIIFSFVSVFCSLCKHTMYAMQK